MRRTRRSPAQAPRRGGTPARRRPPAAMAQCDRREEIVERFLLRCRRTPLRGRRRLLEPLALATHSAFLRVLVARPLDRHPPSSDVTRPSHHGSTSTHLAVLGAQLAPSRRRDRRVFRHPGDNLFAPYFVTQEAQGASSEPAEMTRSANTSAVAASVASRPLFAHAHYGDLSS